MSSLCCCFAKSSEEKGDADFERSTTVPTFRSLSPSPDAGCCCCRCLIKRRVTPSQRRKTYLLGKAPQVCDAAVDTEIDFGIILHDMERGDSENFDKDHKFASLQFDSKPGKVKYIEGSQVFYVEVRDKTLNSHRRNSYQSDKSVSDEDESRMESDMSTDVLLDTKSESRRRLNDSEKSPRRKNSWGKNSGVKNSGIIYVPNKWSPTASIDNLTDKKNISRPFLHEIEEDQEHSTDHNVPRKDNTEMDSLDGYNIGGGQFSPTNLELGKEHAETCEADAREYASSSPDSVPSCIQTDKIQPEAEDNPQDFEGSEFADISSQSVDDKIHISDQDLGIASITESKESANQSTVSTTLHEESTLLIGCSTSNGPALTEDLSKLLIVDRTSSMIFLKSQDENLRESNSCPDMTLLKSNLLDKVTVSPDPSRVSSDIETIGSELIKTENVSKESVNTENKGLSVETQTDVLEKADNIDSNPGERPSVNSVYTETEWGSAVVDQDERRTIIYKEKLNILIKSSERAPSTINSESPSNSGSDSECSFGESETSSNSEAHSKKKNPSNSSDSSCSTCSSSSKSVDQRDMIPNADGESKPKSSSSGSIEGSSSSSSSSNSSSSGSCSNSCSTCALSSSSGSSSSSSTEQKTPNTKNSTSFDLPNGNG